MPRLSRKISPSNDYHQQPAQRPPVESKFPSTEEIARPFRGIHEELRPPRRSGEGSRGWRTGIWGRFFVFVAPFFGNGFVHHSFVASKSLKKFFFFYKKSFFQQHSSPKIIFERKNGRTSPVQPNMQRLMLIHGETRTPTPMAPHEKIPIRRDTSHWTTPCQLTIRNESKVANPSNISTAKKGQVTFLQQLAENSPSFSVSEITLSILLVIKRPLANSPV